MIHPASENHPLDHPPPTRAELLTECRELLYQVSKRPGHVKWLLEIKRMLELFAGYKANRAPIATRSKRKPKPKGATQ